MRLAVDQHRQPLRRRAALRRLFASTVARSPEDEALDRLDARRMLGFADHLAAHERSVLLLRAQGVAAAEVAGELGVSYKSVEGAYTRARRKLRAAAGATAALAALGLRHLLRGISATPAMAAAMATLAVLAVPMPSVASRPAHQPTLTDSVQRSSHRSIPAHDALTVAQQPRDGAQRVSTHTQSTDEASPAANPTTPVVNATVRAAGMSAPVSVHRRNESESFTQSLMTCAEGGISLDPHHLGCNR
jgi:DNA-binding CsgD family transcriptional regulator